MTQLNKTFEPSDVTSKEKGNKMERNFSVGQSNELVCHGQVYDLHNSYDFGGLVVAYRGRVRLWFEPHGEGNPITRGLILDAYDVDWFELSDGMTLGTVRDLEEIGFKSQDDRDLEWLSGERGTTPKDHLVLRFTSDNHIRLHAQTLHLRERNPLEPLPGILDQSATFGTPSASFGDR